MGKAKKRSLHLGINNMLDNMTRQEALSHVINACSKNNVDDDVKNLILLFGLSSEELLENGATYEDVISLKAILK